MVVEVREYKSISNSKKGLEREKNQDRNFIVRRNDFKIFIVFDGVSSLPNSIDFIKYFIEKLEFKLDKVDSKGENISYLLFEINEELIKIGLKGKSTISLLFFNESLRIIKYLNIGDSRIYIFTNQFIEHISHDDNMKLNKNVLTRCLGNNLCLSDFDLKEIKTNYNFLICTDGFYSLMDENLKEYFMTFNFKNLKNIKRKISYLQRGKNNDDSSYIIIKHEV